MKKNVGLTIIFCVLVIALQTGFIFHLLDIKKDVCGEQEKKAPKVLQKITKQFQNYEFNIAKIQGNRIVFYNDQFEQIQEQKMKDEVVQSLKNVRVIKVEKNEDNISFTLTQALDDETGVIFSRSNKISMGGIWKVSRVNRDWFCYSSSM